MKNFISKKFILKNFILISTLIVIISLPISVFADDINDEYNSVLEEFDLSAFELLDNDAKNFLEDLGINEFDYESISSISFINVLKHIFSVLTLRSDGPIKSGTVLIGFIMISAFYCSISSNLSSDTSSNIFSISVNMIIAIFVINKIAPCIALCSSTIKLCGDFTYAFFPAFCIIVATSGGAATSFSVNTTLLILSQLLSVLSGTLFLPVTNCFMTIGICSSINRELNLSSLVASIKSIITKAISTMSAVFVSILSVKTAVASRADALGLRSVRFAINSVVPVIGSSISEGLLSIQSYSSLIKTSVGVVGIIAVVAIFLPALADITIWRIILSCAKISSQIFSDNSCADMIQVFKDVLLIINVVMILTMVTTIISIGILIAAKTGS